MEKSLVDALASIRTRIQADPEISAELHSLTLFGSTVRGDFLPHISDIDFFAVFKNSNNSLPKLIDLISNAVERIRIREVDIPWAFLGDVSDPLNRGYPFKFLTVYQRDFFEHHVVVFGEDVSALVPRYETQKLFPWARERMARNLERFRGDIKMLMITAGEAVKLQAIRNGAKDVSKRGILATIEGMGDVEALRVWRAYIDGRQLGEPEEYWVSFISSRL